LPIPGQRVISLGSALDISEGTGVLLTTP